ncbi:hypothetical protein ABIC03_003443 [Bradyrhizobium sp. RT6a]
MARTTSVPRSPEYIVKRTPAPRTTAKVLNTIILRSPRERGETEPPMFRQCFAEAANGFIHRGVTRDYSTALGTNCFPPGCRFFPIARGWRNECFGTDRRGSAGNIIKGQIDGHSHRPNFRVRYPFFHGGLAVLFREHCCTDDNLGSVLAGGLAIVLGNFQKRSSTRLVLNPLSPFTADLLHLLASSHTTPHHPTDEPHERCQSCSPVCMVCAHEIFGRRVGGLFSRLGA